MTTTDIKNMAVALALGASVAALSDVVIQGVIFRRPSPGGGRHWITPDMKDGSP